MSNLRNSFVLFGAFIVGMAGAQTQGPGHYFERPGIQEFSGQMIVRPLQPSDIEQRGIGLYAGIALQVDARQRLKNITKEYVDATDEFVVWLPENMNENQFSAKLMQTGEYQYVEPNWICYPLRNPNDPLFAQQWHHQKVKSPQAWDLVTGSSTIKVGIVDTGIDLTHPDLAPNRIPGYNSVDRKAEIDGGQVNDLNGHGTHTSGDAAAIGNNGIGVSGMGWNFKIMMCRTSNSPGGGASMDDLMNGARWVVDHGCKVVSVSYSGVDAATIGTTGTYIKSKNSLLCYAAGNDNRNLSGFFYPDTIVVGASNESDQKAGFSAYGRAVHVFAPGTNIVSTTLGGGYGAASGTSMATPIANGAIALIWAANPGLSAQQVQNVLESQCDVIGPSTIFGHGRINQFKNVKQALALLSQNVAPSGITVTQGTYVSGSLSNIILPYSGGATYDVNSVTVPNLGQACSVSLTYNVSALPSKVIALGFTFQTRALPTTAVTGFVYAWNYTTSTYDLLGQSPVTSTMTTQTKSVSSNFSKYVGPGGEVKTLYRPVSTTSGGGGIAFPFTLSIGYAKLAYSAVP